MDSSHEHKPSESKPRYEIADIFRLYLKDYLRIHKLSLGAYKVIQDIMNCRTSELSYHKLCCRECGYERIEYNSCRNRHCPKCQGNQRLKWVSARLDELLPVLYFHSVFTLPHLANELALYNKSLVYDYFMKSCSETLNTFCQDSKYLGAQGGYVGILHTWGQALGLHIHAHFIIPAGGFDKSSDQWKHVPYRKKFLFPVKAMSKYVRKTFCRYLEQAYIRGELKLEGAISRLKDKDNFNSFLNKLAFSEWVNYMKQPFSSPECVVKYLSRYTHRVAISNHRLLDIRDGEVVFTYKQYKDGEVSKKTMRLSAVEFIRRFLLHVMPRGFKKIRYYGFLSSGLRHESIKRIRELLNSVTEKVARTYDKVMSKLFICPDCGQGRLEFVAAYSRSP